MLAGRPIGFVFHDDYEPSFDFNDPMVDEDANESGALYNRPIIDSFDPGNAGASNQCSAPEGWGFATQMSEPQPVAGVLHLVITDHNVMSVRGNLENIRILVPPDILDAGQLLALAMASYPQ